MGCQSAASGRCLAMCCSGPASRATSIRRSRRDRRALVRGLLTMLLLVIAFRLGGRRGAPFPQTLADLGRRSGGRGGAGLGLFQLLEWALRIAGIHDLILDPQDISQHRGWRCRVPFCIVWFAGARPLGRQIPELGKRV